jgi:acetaldehyde dehydrogenase (acetylating)
VLCSSPNSVVVDAPVAEEARRRFQEEGGHFLNAQEMDLLAKALVTPQRLPNPALVGKTARAIAGLVGLVVPDSTRALIAPLTGVGRDFPLSIEKLCPVLSWYVVQDWREGCERCIQILRYGGMGHTMSIHSENQEVILQFGLKKPAFRICVNTPTTHGSIGLTTGLDPAMTLGCGGWGGNSTSDNISPRHLLNLKRLAWGIRPATASSPAPAPATHAAQPSRERLAAAPTRPHNKAITVELLAGRVDQFLASRGYKPGAPPAGATGPAGGAPLESPPAPARAVSGASGEAAGSASQATGTVVDFVCEDDVRAALKHGRHILVGDKTIITPSARDLGESTRVFVHAGWPASR